jgi:hypothetical protein
MSTDLVAPSQAPLEQPERGGSDARESRADWVLGGTISEIAGRLGARTGFLRGLVAVAFWAQPVPVLIAYSVLTLVVPRSGHRVAGARNLIGLARVLLLLVAVGVSRGVVSLDRYGTFGEPPSIWIPVGGVLLILWGWLLLFRPASHESAPGRDRRVLFSIAPAALLALVVLGAAAVPGVRADRVLELGLIVIGVFVAIMAPRLDLAAAVLPTAVLGLLAVVTTTAGAPLQGGIGSLRVTLRTLSSSRLIYRRAFGDVTIDAEHVSGSGTVHLTATTGVGQVTVLLPADASGTVEQSVGSGTVDSEVAADYGGFAVRRIARIEPRRFGPGTTGPLRFIVVERAGEGCARIESPNASESGCPY